MPLSTPVLKNKINYVMVWALIESCGYKALYLILHIIFFRKLPSEIYALQATIFAFLYIGVTAFNRGMDQSLLYHFNSFAFSSKGLHTLFSILKKHFIQTSILVVCAQLGLYYYYHSFFTNHGLLLATLGALLTVELIKKNFKVLLYLTFYNIYVTIAELIGLTLYLVTMGSTIKNGTVTIESFFIYLLGINSCIIIFFGGCIYNYYRSCTQATPSSSLLYNTEIQYQSYFLQIIKTFLSSQLLMPLYVLSTALKNSGHFFLIATMIQTGEFILYKLSYVSGSTFFVYDTKDKNFLSNSLVSIVLKRLFPFYLIVVLIAGLPIFYILPLTLTNIYFTLLYTATLFIDNFLLLYEKYAIVHNKIITYLFYLTSLCAGSWSLLYLLQSWHLFPAITLFFIGKLFLGISIYKQEKITQSKTRQ